MTSRERELECVIADLKEEIKDRHEDYQLLGKDFHAAMEWNRELNSRTECKEGGECGVGGYCEDCYQPIDELNLLRTQVRDLRQQLDDTLKTDQEPAAWMHETEGLSYENCYVGSVPLYWHPVSVVSSDPVGYAHYEKGKLVLLDRNDACMDMLPLYFHPAPVVSSEPVFQVGFGWLKHDHVENGTLLYTAPPSRHLSDEEILSIAESMLDIGYGQGMKLVRFARALEKAK